MQMKKSIVLALAIAAATTQLAYADEATDDSKYLGTEMLAQGLEESSQGQSNGFIEDSALSLFSRNIYYDRNYKNNVGTQNHQQAWGQSERLNFTSGYTQGTVGFGVEAFAVGTFRLDSGSGRGSSPLFPNNASDCSSSVNDVFGSPVCNGQKSAGLAGGAVKLRVSETEIKAGDLQPNSPVFGTWDAYLLPQTVNGVKFSSNEIADLALQGGHFTSGNSSHSTNRNGSLGIGYGLTDFNSANYIGGDYTFSDELSGGLHFANYEDIWNQWYADLYHFWKINDEISLLSSAHYYKTDDAGSYSRNHGGTINTDAFSIGEALTIGAHTFSLGYEQIKGNTLFDYLAIDGDTAGSIWLGNGTQWADFNAPGETSYRVQYDLDASAYGVPGLAVKVKYVTGRDGDTSKADGAYAFYAIDGKGKEWARDVEVSYVAQGGPAKDLKFTLRQSTYRGNTQANRVTGDDQDEVRFITEYPLDIL